MQSFVIYQDGAIGSREQADALGDKTMAIAERLGHLGAIFMVLSDVVREHASHGRMDAVERTSRLIIDVCERGGLPWLYVGHLYAGLAAHWRGDADAAETELRRAVELEPPGAYSGQSAADLALHLAQAGRADEVRTLLEQYRPSFPAGEGRSGIGSWNCLLGIMEALYVAGLRDEAAALAPRVDEALALGPEWIAFDGRLLGTRAGVAAAVLGRWDDAERHFSAALERALRMPSELEAADVRRLHARVLIDRGRPEDAARADELLGRAGDTYREFGMSGYVAEVEGLLGATTR